MILIFEFFIGLFLTFFVGYLLSILLEKSFHINLDNSKQYG